MGVDAYGRWQPLRPADVAVLLREAPFPWWFTGGVALELHTGRSWREHGDIDVGIRRRDAPAVHQHLSGLDAHVAASGVLRPWRGEELHAAAAENNVWVRLVPTGPWVLDLAVGSGNEQWVYRRNEAIRRPWADAVLRTANGLPYLAPELQLLFKSHTLRPRDEQDLREVLPVLDLQQRAALSGFLSEEHPWLALIEDLG